MVAMTSAATPKGTRRRSQLIEAAGSLLLEGGFDAVRHRAVADRAQMPLASTTYYFASLEELMAEAARQVTRDADEAIAARGAAVTRRRRGVGATAEVLSEVFVGVDTPIEELAARYELITLAARYPRLREVVEERRQHVSALHGEVLEKSGRRSEPEQVRWLIAVEDGAVVGTLGSGAESPFAAARAALGGVVDILAPRR
ncbi:MULTISPECIES: TetR/AcrR family transcriptional regulator [unclassified Gordonia (in: high G+C Gram-positive bacteria)]|jgi:DNA-binding transcriptional regulator YbjK|uniref:TetR/AcrR family transcriptional regulator n=1 Tax=Gordonia sp. VNQ95 TaxID=3156619 RepID=UPI0032B56512